MSDGVGTSIISSAGDLVSTIDPGSWATMAHETLYASKQEAAAQKERDRQFRLQQQQFDLTQKLSMQDYREKERQRKWQADFMRYLSQGMGGA